MNYSKYFAKITKKTDSKKLTLKQKLKVLRKVNHKY